MEGRRQRVWLVAAALTLGCGAGCADEGPAPILEPVEEEAAVVLEPVMGEPTTFVASLDEGFEGIEPVEPGSLMAAASHIPMGAMAYGQGTVQQVVLVNPGPGDARVETVVIEGSPTVSATLMGRTASTAAPVFFEPPMLVRAGDMIALQVSANATQPGAFAASVVVDGGPAQGIAAISVDGAVELDEIVAMPKALSSTTVVMPAEGPADFFLSGGASASPDGAIVGYQWVAVSTTGAEAQFLPNPHVAAPTLRVTEPGDLEVRLSVIDEHGVKSPLSAALDLQVTDDTAIEVEVVWQAPDGADLDVHLVHPMGVGFGTDVDGDGEGDGWFDAYFDCWEDNPITYWPTDDPDTVTSPSVTTDSATQDCVALPVAQSTGAYPVAVHYVPGSANASAIAHLEVRVHGALIWASSPMKLQPGDLWTPGEIRYSDAGFTAAESFAAPTVVPAVEIP